MMLHVFRARQVRENLTVVSELRVAQINTTLSLVATIFLPLTFLTGVFGMNFQFDKEYPVGLSILNQECVGVHPFSTLRFSSLRLLSCGVARYGALYFWTAVTSVVVLSATIFYIKGWSELLTRDQLAWG